MRKLLLLTGLLLLACASFFFSPAPTGRADEEYWGTYAQMNSRMGFVINGDTREYIADAREPNRLLNDKEVRQSRPLYILLGSALGYPLQGVLSGVNVADTWGGIAAESPDFLGFYAAYVLLNFGVLLASLLLFAAIYKQLAGENNDPVVLYGLSWFLVSNPITKAFFWTAHQQMFAFFTPLLFIYGLLRYRNVRLTWQQSIGWALVLGLSALVYGNFVLALLCLLYQLFAHRVHQRPMLALLRKALAVIVCFVLPTFIWIGILKLHGVTYYNQEAVRFHQFTWMLDAWRESPSTFFSTLGDNLLLFLANLRTISVFLIAVIVLAGVQLRRGGKEPAGAWAVLGFVFLLFFAFYALMGYYPERLTFTLVPVLLCMIALLLRRPVSYQRPLVLAAALGWHLYQVFSYGPFS